MNRLQVGDRIYKCYRDKVVSIMEVTRTTKTLAICQGERFKIEYDSPRNINISSGYSVYWFGLESPDLIARYEKKIILEKVEKTIFSSLSTDQLQRIESIAKET